jgi:DNA invertase Pin-like site-specific DNA recombinase
MGRPSACQNPVVTWGSDTSREDVKPSEGFGTIGAMTKGRCRSEVVRPRGAGSTARDTSSSAPAAGDLIGYARVSTDGQNLSLQLDALEQAGCRRVFNDVGSGSLKHRPQLDDCLTFLAPGDTLVVWRLDRLGRGLKHLIDTIEELHEREIGFRSLTEQIDTTTPGGRLQFHIFGALAQFEREIIRERTRAGLAAARARNQFGGRPTVITADKLTAARLMRAEKRPMHVIAKTLGISRSTLYRHLAPDKQGEQRA